MKKILIVGTTVVLGLAAFGAMSSASSFDSENSNMTSMSDHHQDRNRNGMTGDEFLLNKEKRSSGGKRMMDSNNHNDNHMKNNRRGYCHR
ncbi:hypothetical protein OL233_03795 [Vagococcus sp. PNs007]|uniref:Uncharacterized protein n=1 Tax=Vagococcus proximus TaxID=2991417 RepID=A0ABT5X072_9ENTE|nr:hypothetical protein [Vagococcus proximus]MDF0479403.1 hypothetical protein [Vagococcus proximus]